MLIIRYFIYIIRESIYKNNDNYVLIIKNFNYVVDKYFKKHLYLLFIILLHLVET